MLAVSRLQPLTAPGVTEDDVDVKEPDPELQLFLNVEILVLISAGEAALSLSCARVVRAREEELIKAQLTELRSSVTEDWRRGRTRVWSGACRGAW